MHDGSPSPGPRRGGAPAPGADVLVHGDERPQRPVRRTAAVLGLAAVVALVLMLTGRGEQQPAATPDLRWVETGGATSVAWGYGGRLEVSLPLLLHNDGPAVTVGSAGLARNALVHPALDVALAPGGRLPLTLQRSMDCPASARVPGEAIVWFTVRTEDGSQRRLLPLPDRLRDALAEALQEACDDVPLSHAVALSTRSGPPQDGAVVLRVAARNVREQDVRLRSVDAVTGLRVVAAPDAATPATVPTPLGKRPVVLRLRVEVADCARLVPADAAGRVPVADVGYDDRSGAAAAGAVLDETGAVQALVDGAC